MKKRNATFGAPYRARQAAVRRKALIRSNPTPWARIQFAFQEIGVSAIQVGTAIRKALQKLNSSTEQL